MTATIIMMMTIAWLFLWSRQVKKEAVTDCKMSQRKGDKVIKLGISSILMYYTPPQ